MRMSSKTTPFSLELFSFVKQLAELIEEHLDLGPTFHGSACFEKHQFLPKSPTLVGLKHQFKTFILTPSNCVETFRC